MILSACMMLDHIGDSPRADRIRQAIAAVVAEGKVQAYDMLRLPGGPAVLDQGAATKPQITDAIIANL
jgi:isocitrate dehydrogenase (NAD+)